MEAAVATPAGEVGRLVGELRRVADELLAVSGSAGVGDARQVAAGLVAVTEAAHVVEAARLGLVRALGAVDVRETGATSVAALLGWRCRTAPGRARADVAAARAVDPDAAAADAANGGTRRGEAGALARMGAALAQGRVSRAHLDVAVRVLEKVPTRMRSAAAATVDEFLVEVSGKYPPRECENLAAELLDRLDPDRSERGFDPDAFARRRFDLVADSTGMLVVRGQLDPMTGARLKAAVERLAAPDPAAEVVTDDGGTLVVRDERTPSQRRADAIGLLASRVTAAPGSSTAGAGGDAARVVVHATLDQVAALGSADPRERADAGRAWCEQIGFVPADVLERLGCSAVFQRVLLAPDGGVLNLGRSARLASPAQRRALAARDRGCVAPGCTRPANQADAHHVSPWSRGGRTDVDELVLLCGPHHQAVHAGVLDVVMRAGVPWVRLPAWVDPHRRLVRNTVHHDAARARTVGRQLRLDLTPAAPHVRQRRGPDPARSGPAHPPAHPPAHRSDRPLARRLQRPGGTRAGPDEPDAAPAA